MLSVGAIGPDLSELSGLRAESEQLGYRMLQRLEEGWRSGANRFDKPGEALFGAWQDHRLLGVCGRNRDPFDQNPRAGRVRHLYVAATARGNGVGRALVGLIIDGAGQWFDYLNTNAPPEAARFYERLGFLPVVGERVTHRLPV